MSTIITCQCGVKVRVPEAASEKAFRCPKCKAEIAAPVQTRVAASSTPAESDFQPKVIASSQPVDGDVLAQCPICLTGIEATAPSIHCSACGQIHHEECWAEMGGCATYGCERAPAIAKEGQTAARPLTAWGDTKKCPACGETIKSIALRCRYCGEDFDTVDPLAVGDLRRGARKSEKLRNLRIGVVVLFVLSLIGCGAPLMLIIAPLVLWPQRKLLTQAGPFYLILGYASILLSALYSLLMLLFFLFSRIH
jgi:hypothetical protein